MSTSTPAPTIIFPIPTLTVITGKPDYQSLAILHREVNTNSINIPSACGGGAQGHLALVITTTKFDAITETIPWVNPVHPGATPVAGMTAAQITENNRIHNANLTEYL